MTGKVPTYTQTVPLTNVFRFQEIGRKPFGFRKIVSNLFKSRNNVKKKRNPLFQMLPSFPLSLNTLQMIERVYFISEM